MLRFFRENLVLKLISLLTSIVIWFYVSAERTPMIKRQVNAEVQTIGTPPDTVIVRIKPQTVPVEVIGPSSEVDSIAENDVKAIVNLRSARPNTQQLPIARYEPPQSARNVTFRPLREYVTADVIPKQRKQMPIEFYYNNVAPFGRKYSAPKLEPAFANVVGTKEDIQRVARLVVNIDTKGGSIKEDLPIQAVDKDGVAVDVVKTEPERTRVELSLVEAPATRTLLVSVSHIGQVPPPYTITAITVEPDQVTVSGKPDLLAQLTSVPVSPISVDNVTTDITRELPLLLPPNVTVQNGSATVKVTVRIRDATRGNP